MKWHLTTRSRQFSACEMTPWLRLYDVVCGHNSRATARAEAKRLRKRGLRVRIARGPCKNEPVPNKKGI